MSWQLNQIDQQLIQLALLEDLGQPYLDITSELLFKSHNPDTTVQIVSKHVEPIILSGLPLIPPIMQQFTDAFTLSTPFKDGDIIEPAQVLLTLSADSKSLMMAERTILNFLQRLCGIATLTHKLTQAVQHTNLKILDTRKTLPGHRHLDKYAVHCGGGVNHRMGLYDALMIKDNHIDLLGGIKNVLKKLPQNILEHYPVIIEVRDIKELKMVLRYGKGKVTRILLDNMAPYELSMCVEKCDQQLPLEASGGVNLENIVEIAETGVNYASIGMLTHTVTPADLSLRKQ